MTDADTYERYFVTQDKASGDRVVTFKLIEDESGDIFWGYGHRDADEFVAEVNRWILHVDGDVWEGPHGSVQQVEHLYVTPEGPEFERFRQVPADSGAAVVLPVTRLTL